MSLLTDLEQRAAQRGLLLRLQVGRPLGVLVGLRVGVARSQPGSPALELLGELKGWAWPPSGDLRLDSFRVAGRSQAAPNLGVGPLIAAATFAWALEHTPCRRALILAICDDPMQHKRLVRYFQGLGFLPQKTLGAALWDLPERVLWGGAGLLMEGDCQICWQRSLARLNQNWS